MESSSAKEKIAASKTSSDPFAADIFTTDYKIQGESQTQFAPPVDKSSAWQRRLPKIARPAVDWNFLSQNLPADFSDELPTLLADALARHLNLSEKDSVEFLFLSNRETNEAENDAANDSWFINLAIENSQADFSIEIDNTFAGWLVDAMLEENASSDAPTTRNFTTSEIAVLEFLAVNLTAETNRILNAPLFKLRSVNQSNINSSNRRNGSENAPTKIVSTWQTVHNLRQNIVNLHITPETLIALQTEENKLLTAKPRRAVNWKSLENLVKDVRARVFFGEAQTSLADIAGLETGDVVLLENYDYYLDNGIFHGRADVLFGDGEQTKIVGAFESSLDEAANEIEESGSADDNKFLVRKINDTRPLRFFVEAVEGFDDPQLAKKIMPEETVNREVGESFDEMNEAGGVPLENLAVTVRVELETGRLTLAEVGNLRLNQIVELGARATDPVNVLIENKIIARGELVEVEDRLGVRIIQILR